jgi:transcriptional regulator with XRE-family HTH domain
MSTRERKVERGSIRARATIAELGSELRRARLDCSLSQAQVGRAAGLSAAEVSRIERGLIMLVPLWHLARLLETVGLELSARAYPAGSPIRDDAHRRLLDRFRSEMPREIPWAEEVPLPIAGDKRAWDGALRFEASRVAVEAETRPRDLQALLRRIVLKRRDDPSVGGVVLVLADTRHNRALVRDSAEALAAAFPLSGREIMEALRVGKPPRDSGIVLL